MKNTLTIYFIPSPLRLDWSTPTKLARSILLNKLTFKKRFMGHVNIELKYKGEHYLTGMAASKLNAPELLLKDNIGLGVIFHIFKGRLEDKEDLVPELTSYLKIGNKAMNFIEYEISDDAAERIKEYLTQFKEKKLDSYYGLFNSPLHGEGAGCSAFGASVLEVVSLLTDEHKKEWTRCFKVPHSLAGAPLTNNKISFFNLLFKNYTWAKDGEKSTEIFFFDPDLMHAWVEKKLNEKSARIIAKENAKGIYLNAKDSSLKESIFKISNVISRKPDFTTGTNLDKYVNSND